jgi:uncharacterized protein involved in high-affinity Fe2+ transport
MNKKLVGIALAAMMAMSLAACGDSDSSSDSKSTADTTAATTTAEAADAEVKEDAAAAPGEDAGFTEIPIFEDEQIDFINLSAVYFQPVPMSPGQENIDGFDIHLEADIAALENDLGYGVGDWIPYLTVDYDVIGSDGQSAASGTFMEMSASDGPHYGANIALPNADTYSIKFTIHSPAENGYLIHSDSETGPGGVLEDHFANGNLEYTFEGWEYTPQEW